MPKKPTKEKFYTGFKIIAKYLKPYKKELMVLSILGVFSAIANGGVPYLIGRLIDAVITPETIVIGGVVISLAVFFLSLWIILQLIAAVADWRNRIKSVKLGVIVDTDYIAKAFGHLLELPLSFHKTHKIGEIAEKFNRTSDSLYTLISNVIIRLAPQFLSIIVALVLTFIINTVLSFILIAGVTIYIVIVFNLIKPLAVLQRRMMSFFSQAHGIAHDAVLNTHEIKQSTAEQYEQERIMVSFKQKAGKAWITINKIWEGLTFYQKIIILLTQLALFIISIIFIQQGKMTIGELVMFNAYAAMLFGPFVTLGHNWQIVQNGLLAIERGEKIMQTPTEIYTPPNAVELKTLQGDVSFKNVDFYYEKETPVLKDITFDVKAGEVVALVGGSGEGKSTLIDLISGYYFPKKGDVFIDGHDIKKLDLTFLRSHIAVVPQEVVLFNDTIEKNLKYGIFQASREEIEEAARKAYALDFIEKFPKKWKQLVGERGIKLSVGQKQRVAIARALLRDPKILILDEPTSALDAHSERHIQESLKELMRGRTTFIIAHRLSTVRRADTILVFKGGQIVERGTHEGLIKKKDGVYRGLYELQIGLHE